jgi:hypothetical protein
MTHGGGLLLGSFGSDNQGVEPLLEDLGVGGRKGDDARWNDDRRRGGGVNSAWAIVRRYCSAREHCGTVGAVAREHCSTRGGTVAPREALWHGGGTVAAAAL